MERLAHTSVIVGAVLGLAGCGSLPLQYDLDLSKTQGYVSKETLETIKNDGLTVAQVKSLLGEPKGEIDEASPALGYLHCARWTGECRDIVFLIPASKYPCRYTSCQLVGIWFDEKGHAAETRTEELDDRLKSCSVNLWLSTKGSTRKSCDLASAYDR